MAGVGHRLGSFVEAMKTVELRHFDLAVMDMVMPEKEGIETIIELKEKRPDMRIIAVSGGARFGLTGEVKLEAQDALRLARRIGANYCFSKPVDNEALIAAARELTGQE